MPPLVLCPIFRPHILLFRAGKAGGTSSAARPGIYLSALRALFRILDQTAKMVVWAIQNAKTLDRDGVRDALDTIDGLELPSGKMTMDPTTRNPIKGGIIMQYDAEGVTHYVSSVNP